MVVMCNNIISFYEKFMSPGQEGKVKVAWLVVSIWETIFIMAIEW